MQYDDLNRIQQKFLIVLITANEKSGEKINGKKFIDNYSETNNLEIEFKVNGFTFDILELFNRLDKSVDDLIEEKARELMRERFSGITDKLTELEANVADLVVYTDTSKKG